MIQKYSSVVVEVSTAAFKAVDSEAAVNLLLLSKILMKLSYILSHTSQRTDRAPNTPTKLTFFELFTFSAKQLSEKGFKIYFFLSCVTLNNTKIECGSTPASL